MYYNNPNFFAESLPVNEHWRLFSEFRESVCYLDIETNGLNDFEHSITTIAIYDGKEINYYVRGKNLDYFGEDIQKYKVLITFNGKSFDVPFIQRDLGIDIPHTHIDLRHVLKSEGYTGGLKSCERQLGLDRGELDGVDGLFAVHLWNRYVEEDDKKALDTLLAYNIEDVINLELLMIKIYNMKVERTPFEKGLLIGEPEMPELPFTPDVETLNKIRSLFY